MEPPHGRQVCGEEPPLKGSHRKHKVRYWRPLRGDSPRGGEMSRSDRGDGALFALDAERPEGWFPVQNLKIHRARPVKRADGEHRPLQMICNVCGAGWMGGNY